MRLKEKKGENITGNENKNENKGIRIKRKTKQIMGKNINQTYE